MKPRLFFAVVLTAILLPLVSLAQETQTEIFVQQPGMVVGQGHDFQINDSDYVNASIHSSEAVFLTAESAGYAVMLTVEPVSATYTTTITVSNLVPERTYYQYIDNFHEISQFQANVNGEYTFTLDITEPHVIFLQEHHSTLFLNASLSGGDCQSIGTWDISSLTCTLTQDVTDTIQIDSNNLILDGAGFTLSGSPTLHTGIFIVSDYVTIKNLRIANFIRGIYINRRSINTIEQNTFDAKNQGIGIFNGHQNIISNNTFYGDLNYNPLGIQLISSNDNEIIGNIINNFSGGISLLSRNNGNTITGNNITAESAGLYFNIASNNNISFGNDIDVPASQNPAIIQGNSVGNVFHQELPVGGNYWTAYDEPAEGCTDTNNDKFCDAPFVFLGGQDNYPHVGPVTSGEDAVSNVLFIPGFQASRLYRQGPLGEDQLWPPSNNHDAEQLFLNDNGESIDPNIYTRDIIDEVLGLNIYKDFIRFMDEDLVAAGVINEWRPYPYDWRLPIDEIAAQPALKNDVNELAASSANGKVTIIAHSNGGLIGKLLLNDSDIADKIDQFIMVGTPQLGTPKALVGLLHGDGQNLLGGFLVTKETARELGENMPGAYGLLPSEIYFDTVADPVVQFTDQVAQHYDFVNLYSDTIDTFSELFSFLSGDDGARAEPAADDTDSPNILSQSLLNNARDLHATLDDWTPPAEVEVTQIAGWGLDTIYAIEYDNCDFCPFGKNLSNLDREVQKTFSGDQTVVVPSAITDEFSKYFLNVLEFNKDNLVNRSHKNILDVAPLQELINKMLTEDNFEVPEYVSISEPQPTLGDLRLRLRMKSPVAVHIHDSSNRHTGKISNSDSTSDLQVFEENIPNSSYFELGEKKYISLDSDDTYTISLDGEDSGTFTFEIDTVEGDNVIHTASFNNVPVTKSLVGELTLSPDSSFNLELKLDLQGNGQLDVVLFSNESMSTADSLIVLEQAIQDIELDKNIKDVLLKRVQKISKFVEQGKVNPAKNNLKSMENYIEAKTGKTKGISEEDSEKLQKIIAVITDPV